MDRCIITIALNTAREITRQAVFYCILGGGIGLILFSFVFTLFAFGEELRMIKEMGISTITICCLCLASLCATNAISREIEKGTIITLLSKPISKKSVLLGKFFGILLIVSLTCAIMGISLVFSLSVKDARDSNINLLSSFINIGGSAFFQFVFLFLQVSIMCAIAVAGSIYLPIVANFSLCMCVYIVGNLINFFHNILGGNEGGFPWCISLLSIIFPNLESFSAIGMGNWVEKFNLSYLAMLIVYAILYTALVITLACEFFDRKECY